MTQGIPRYRLQTVLIAGLMALAYVPVAPQAVPSSTATTSQGQIKPEPAARDDDKRTAKQKLLDDQAQKLVAMAIELKVEVDKTNKNILSLQVVHKAEEIEALAHKMKDLRKQ